MAEVLAPLKVFQEVFGYKAFRLNQEAVINRTLEGKDSLVIMPTGGGKSACYQVPAVMLEGTALVISPLIALMEDQVAHLQANGIKAEALNSNATAEQEQDIEKRCKEGEIKLLYVSPERAVSPSFSYFLEEIKLSLIAIDEAHCVSIWGNDFRKEYTYLHTIIQKFPEIPHLALTATADRATQEDIVNQLKLNEPEFFLSSFKRENIAVKVLPAQKRYQAIKNHLHYHKGHAGIIYCLSRKSTEDLAQKLVQDGYKAAAYHAGMPANLRQRVQENFQKDDVHIICATIAFGMGIDKSNIRWVIHYNLPKNIESYYQEIGRAGRDGMAAKAILFFSFGDIQVLRGFVTGSEASEEFKAVQLAKLDRMLEFCQAGSCRTNMVLSYFGEHTDEPCGTCDNCKNPPKNFDGTILAQKAFSACKRLNEQVNMTMLVDVLRGARKAELLDRGYDKIKTYGSGAEESNYNWLQYITQLINQGYLEIDYTRGSRLKTTALADKVLFDGYKVNLVKPMSYEERQSKMAAKPESKAQVFDGGLMDALKKLRKELATKQQVPAYVIFPDSTLQSMVEEKPITLQDMGNVSGVGQFKLQEYGEQFIKVIQGYLTENKEVKKVKGQTHLETLQLFKEGKSPEQIAEVRNLNVVTIYSHLAALYEKGEAIPLETMIDQKEVDVIKEAWEATGKEEGLKPVFEHLNEEVPYYKIRIGLTLLQAK